MAWYTGKANLVGIALGDSNTVGVGGFQIGVQTFNPNIRCYSTTDAIPYNLSELEWRTLDPNSTSRYDQMYETLVSKQTYIGQVLGGNGAAALQMADTIQRGTGCETFWLYQGAQGGTDANNWANGENWDTMLAELPGALAAIPGSPTYADVIYISLGGNDFLGLFNTPAVRYTGEQFYTNFNTLRSKMIAEGWWLPGTTQIVLGDIFRNGTLYEPWYGLEYVKARFNDRITLVSSVGATYLDEFINVHFDPRTLTRMGKEAGRRVLAHIPIPWYYNKTVVAAACIGDSNAFASGGFTPPGGQTANTGVYCYASASGQTPYDEANMGWRNLDPNGTARIDEYTSYLATVGNIGFIGQMLGGNGNSGMQAASTVEQDIHLDNYLYQCAAGGTTADFWANGDGWDTLERTIPTALESIPGSPTAFDYILFSLGVNDATQDYTAEQFYTHFKTLRTKMVAAGWWIPGTTQIIILDTPKSGSFADDYSDWEGLTEVLTRFNDLIAVTDSIGYELDPAMDVHYLPPYYSDAGVQAGELVLSDIQRKPKTLSVGGTRVTIGGYAIQIYGTAA